MSQTYNVYCDESCHMENDHQTVMVLGASGAQLKKRVRLPFGCEKSNESMV